MPTPRTQSTVPPELLDIEPRQLLRPDAETAPVETLGSDGADWDADPGEPAQAADPDDVATVALRLPSSADSAATAPVRRVDGPSITARAAQTAKPETSPVVLAQAADRFAERRKSRRWRALRRVLAGLAAAAAAAGLVWLIFFSTVLVLDPAKVVVEGQSTTVDPAQVAALAEPWAGTQLARIDTGALREQILGITAVKDARVDRAWPNGLHIGLTAREPVVAIADAGQYLLLDDEAVHVATAAEVPPGVLVMDLPTDVTAETLTAARTVLAALGPDLAAQVVEIGAKDPVTVWFKLADGPTVQWGSATDNELKLAVLQALRTAPETAGSRAIDITTPTAPITS